jgi:hypothetical protein
MRFTALVLACMAFLVAVPTAGADSLVFTRDSNVWLANPDGSGQYQVTLDGTASSPYSRPPRRTTERFSPSAGRPVAATSSGA